MSVVLYSMPDPYGHPVTWQVVLVGVGEYKPPRVDGLPATPIYMGEVCYRDWILSKARGDRPPRNMPEGSTRQLKPRLALVVVEQTKGDPALGEVCP